MAEKPKNIWHIGRIDYTDEQKLDGIKGEGPISPE
jgi:hypothetical protein